MLSQFLFRPEFESKFAPTCLSNELYYSVNECTDPRKLGNSYDNSIFYTDYFLSQLTDLLQASNSIMFYISDHGESLGENGIYAHSLPMQDAPIEQIHVPFLFWASEHFMNMTGYQAAFNNAYYNGSLPVDQSYIFHSILDCIGINSEAIDRGKSICNKIMLPAPIPNIANPSYGLYLEKVPS